VLAGEAWQRRHRLGVARNPFGDVLADGDRKIGLSIEHDDVAVGKAERADLGAALVAAHGLVADAFDMACRARLAAARTELCDEGIAEIASLDELHHPGRGRQRRYLHFPELDRDRVADFGAFDHDGKRHFMAALEFGRDHRPPAAGRRAGADRPAVLDDARAGDARPHDAPAILVHFDQMLCFGHANPPLNNHSRGPQLIRRGLPEKRNWRPSQPPCD
jgi:hypothetical protein